MQRNWRWHDFKNILYAYPGGTHHGSDAATALLKYLIMLFSDGILLFVLDNFVITSFSSDFAKAFVTNRLPQLQWEQLQIFNVDINVSIHLLKVDSCYIWVISFYLH